MVGLDRLELSTSPLSGVRSSHLSYRPAWIRLSAETNRANQHPEAKTGGAGRDRTGDLLNANQALSQLSYSPFFTPKPDLHRCKPGPVVKTIEASWKQCRQDQLERQL
jgi:hypothetical protein